MTQKKNDCEIILIDSVEEQRKPIKILKKHVSHMGVIKYLVEYPNEQSWESEKFMKEKYLELVEDFNYFSVCGNRYDQATLNQKRENHLKLATYETYTNLPIIPHDDNYPIFKRQKIKDKQIDKFNNQPESQPAIACSRALVEQQLILTQQLNSIKADLGDTIKSVSIENGLFFIEWNPRPDSTVPYSEYYTYDQLKATAPNVLLQFMEKELLENDQKFKSLKRSPVQVLKIIPSDDVALDQQNSNHKNDSSVLTKKTNDEKDTISIKSNDNKTNNDKKTPEKMIPEEVKGSKELLKEKEAKIVNSPIQQVVEIKSDQKLTVEKDKPPAEKDTLTFVEKDKITIAEKDRPAVVAVDKQIPKKKGVVPSIKPTEKIQQSSTQKLKKATDQSIIQPDKPHQSPTSASKTPEKLMDKSEKAIEKPVKNQQITITCPNVYQPQQFKDDLEIMGSFDKPENKYEKQKANYEKELEECYSDVEIPQFQFHQLEF